MHLRWVMGNGLEPRFPTSATGGIGVIAIKDGVRNGETIGARQIEEGDQVGLITDSGGLGRTEAPEIPQLGRNTQGVRLYCVE
ncbi:MAG: hypothetical protein CM1200mP41_26610 [Gammaproteobacteria bacterium]|nr:MAG: hypothetical protein CM1200mP41_26610 [Gammaproteobacteria bacterium]